MSVCFMCVWLRVFIWMVSAYTYKLILCCYSLYELLFTAKYCPNIENIKVSHLNIGNRSLAHLAKSCTKLKSLSFNGKKFFSYVYKIIYARYLCTVTSIYLEIGKNQYEVK